jgi:hypothetical protein
MGTAPTNSASHLQFSSEVSSNSARLTFWPVLGNRAYQLLSRPQIGQNPWLEVTNAPLTATPDGRGVFTLPLSNAPQNFYRLKVQMSTNNSFSGSFAVPAGKSYSPFASDPLCGPNRAYIR